MIIDSHTHIFREMSGRVAEGAVRGLPWGKARVGEREMQLLPPFQETTTFSASHLLAQMDWARVQGAVLLQGPFYGPQTDVVLEALREHPGRLAGAAYLDPWEEGWEKELEHILAAGGFCAVKLEMSEPTGLCGLHPSARLSDTHLDLLWRSMEEAALTLVVDLGAVGGKAYQTDAVRAILQKHPRLHVVIPHLGQITPAVEANLDLMRLWDDQMHLGLEGNVWFDCSSLTPALQDETYPYPSMGKYLRHAWGTIGPRRVMWGSDIPGLLSSLLYPQIQALALEHAAPLSAEERSWFFGGNACEAFRLQYLDREVSGELCSSFVVPPSGG